MSVPPVPLDTVASLSNTTYSYRVYKGHLVQKTSTRQLCILTSSWKGRNFRGKVINKLALFFSGVKSTLGKQTHSFQNSLASLEKNLEFYILQVGDVFNKAAIKQCGKH